MRLQGTIDSMQIRARSHYYIFYQIKMLKDLKNDIRLLNKFSNFKYLIMLLCLCNSLVF